MQTRRQFLRNGAYTLAAIAGTPGRSPLLSQSAAQPATQATVQTLRTGWQFLRMPLAAPWQVWSDQPLAPWQPVTLPHCYNAHDACDPDLPAYRGKGWYRRTLATSNPYPGGRTLLHFEGAGQSSEIYLDDELLARHNGGYDEFTLDITDALPSSGAEKPVRLSLLCDNSPDLERMPSDLSDFTLYGGLYRDVHLVHVPAVSIETMHLPVRIEESAANVSVRLRLRNPNQLGGSVYCTVSITDANDQVVGSFQSIVPVWQGMQEIASIPVAHPQLWSPRSPHLYRCTVALRTDSGESLRSECFGIRSFHFQPHGAFFLNGERLLLRGTHRHQDHSDCAAAMTADQMRAELQMIHAMGANFIRLAHYQQPALVLDLCDELGLIVWEELPWCRAGVGDAAFQSNGRQKLSAMIDQHFNHASIFFWGLGNEDDWPGEYPSVDHAAIRSFMIELNTLAHSLDPDRLTSLRRCDFARDIPDVYSPSIWAGWYGGRYQEYQASLEAARQAVPRLLHIEWGADSHARRHAEDPYAHLSGVTLGDTAERGLAYQSHGGPARVSRDGDWSETYACDLFDWHLMIQERLPWLAGAAQWIFKDFTTPLRVENPIPRVNQKGVVERDLTPKESFYVFQSYWSEQPMVRIYGHTWPVRWGRPGDERLVRVYSNCASVELFLNDRSLGRRTRSAGDFPCSGLRWMTPFAEGDNQLRAVAHLPDGTTLSDSVQFRYQTAAWAAPAELRLRIEKQSPGHMTIEATLHDAHGILCLDARNRVRFSLAGPGLLLDNQGTVGGSRQVELANGRAWITLSKAAPGSVLAITSDGLPTATLPLFPASH